MQASPGAKLSGYGKAVKGWVRATSFGRVGALAKNFTSAYIAGLSELRTRMKTAMAERRTGGGSRRPATAQAGEVMGAGLQFAAAIVVFLFIGQWLDGVLGTKPWLLLIGVMVGAAGGFFSLYRQLVIVPRDRERRQQESKKP